jgi:hypothetical protein
MVDREELRQLVLGQFYMPMSPAKRQELRDGVLALLAERDQLRAEVEAAEERHAVRAGELLAYMEGHSRFSEEREAWTAENDRLREALGALTATADAIDQWYHLTGGQLDMKAYASDFRRLPSEVEAARRALEEEA